MLDMPVVYITAPHAKPSAATELLIGYETAAIALIAHAAPPKIT